MIYKIAKLKIFFDTSSMYTYDIEDKISRNTFPSLKCRNEPRGQN